MLASCPLSRYLDFSLHFGTIINEASSRVRMNGKQDEETSGVDRTIHYEDCSYCYTVIKMCHVSNCKYVLLVI